MMRGCQYHAVLRAKLVQQRHRQRGAFFRRRSRAHFIHQDERIRRRCLQHGLQVQHMRREGGQIRRDRLLVADVHQHAVEQRQDHALRGHRNSGLRRQRGHSRRFQRHGLAAGVWSADHQHAFFSAKGQSHRNNGAIFLAEFVLQHRMARAFQTQFICCGEFRDRGVKFPRESRARKHTVEFRNCPGCRQQRSTDHLQLFRERPQNPHDFRGFILRKLHELVVGLDGLERLHKYCLPRRARSVYHSRKAPPLLRPHGNHETIVPQRDVVFSRFRIPRAQNLLQILLDRFASLRDARSDSPQRR